MRSESDFLWDDYVDRHPAGTTFHRMPWLRVVSAVLGKTVFLLTSRSTDGKIRGLLPLFLCRTMRDRALISVPFRDHGGPLAEDAAALAELIIAARELACRHGANRITFQRVDPSAEKYLAEEKFSPSLRGIDTCLDLDISEEEHWEKIKSPVRRAVKKARNNGVTVDVETSNDAFEAFYEVFLGTRRRLGVVSYPGDFFSRLHQEDSERVRLLTAKMPDGRRVGGLIIFLHGATAYSGYLGHDEKFSDLRVVDLLFWNAFCLARKAGARRFFMGTDSSSQESLIKFKTKWLAKSQEVQSWHWTNTGRISESMDTESSKFRFVRGALRVAPKPLFLLASRIGLRFWE